MQVLGSLIFPRKSCYLRDNIEKYCIAAQTTEDNITRLVLFVSCVIKATGTYSALLFYHDNNGYVKAPQGYVMRTFHVLLCAHSMSCYILRRYKHENLVCQGRS